MTTTIDPKSTPPKKSAPSSIPATNTHRGMHQRTAHAMVAIIRFMIPVAVLGFAITGAIWLISAKPLPPQIDMTPQATLVETIIPVLKKDRATVTGYGTIQPFRSLTLQSQVGGQVTEINDSLVIGGMISRGEVLFQIDKSNYELAVQQRKADVATAEVGLQMTEAGRLVAEREWELLGETIETTELGRQLARKEPQRLEALAKLAAAEGRLQLAQLDLERTTVTAPFNAIVKSDMIEIGQVVGPMAPAATLVGTDRFEVIASIPLEKLSWLVINSNDPTQNSAALVTLELGDGRNIQRSAQVDRILGEVERDGRLAQVILSIDDPLSINADTYMDRLLLGSYVRVEIMGPELTDVMEIPRSVIHENDTVRVMDRNNTLAIRSLDVLVGKVHSVLANAQLEQGDEIISSPLGVPITGMALQRIGSAGKAKRPSDPNELGRGDVVR